MVTEPARGRVFISYSRKDLAAAERVRDALIERGFDAYLDIHDIAPGEPWRERLGALIAAAEKVVFLISTNSVASEICDWEVNEAERLGKSVTPVVIRETAVETIPPRLSRLNFVFLRDEAGRTEALDKIEAALTIDLAWEREKTRVNDLAEAWARADRPRRLLITRNDAIAAAERWRDAAPMTSPPLTETQRAFIAESRRAYGRRMRWIAGGSAVAAVAMLALAVFAYWQSVSAEIARAAEAERRAEAEAHRNEALKRQSLFLAEKSHQSLAAGDAATGVLLGLASMPDLTMDPAGDGLDPRPAVVEAEFSLNQALSAQREGPRLFGHADDVVSVAYSPDGKRIVTASRDGTARIWDSKDGVETAILKGHSRAVLTAEFSSDGTRVVTTSLDSTVRIWNTITGIEEARIGDGQLDRAVLDPDGSIVVTMSDFASNVLIWDIAGSALIGSLEGHTATIASASFSPDGDEIVTTSLDGTARIWDVVGQSELAVLTGHRDVVGDAVFSPDGTKIVTTSWDRTARIWDAETHALIATFNGHSDAVSSAMFSPNGRAVLTVSLDGTARIWRSWDGAEITKLEDASAAIEFAVFSPDGSQIATASRSGVVRLWDAYTGAAVAALESYHSKGVAAFSPDGLQIVTSAPDNTARIWRKHPIVMPSEMGLDLSVRFAGLSSDSMHIIKASLSDTLRLFDAETGAEVATISTHPENVTSFELSADKSRIVTVSTDRQGSFGTTAVWVWDAATGEKLVDLKGSFFSVRAAAFSPGGERIVTSSRGWDARVWDAATGAELTVLDGHLGEVLSATFSPDGTRIATTSSDNTARIWDAETYVLITTLEGHSADVVSAVFSADAHQIVTVSNDATARLWNTTTGEENAVLDGHSRRISSAAFSPGGGRIVTASADNTIRLWDVSTGVEISRFVGSASGIAVASFSHDGSEVVAVLSSGQTSTWSARTGQDLVAFAKLAVPRCLTPQQLRKFFLPSEPPRWCITGPGREAETDPALWEPKYPYQADEWRDWLIARDRGEEQELPGAD